jgi:hypothetical protein
VWKMIHHDHSSYNEYIYAVLKWVFFFHGHCEQEK